MSVPRRLPSNAREIGLVGPPAAGPVAGIVARAGASRQDMGTPGLIRLSNWACWG